MKPKEDMPKTNYELQPPSGGCVLKLKARIAESEIKNQPPSGGCVLKPAGFGTDFFDSGQPPSGGCVLKHRPSERLIKMISSRLQAAVC